MYNEFYASSPAADWQLLAFSESGVHRRAVGQRGVHRAGRSPAAAALGGPGDRHRHGRRRDRADRDDRPESFRHHFVHGRRAEAVLGRGGQHHVVAVRRQRTHFHFTAWPDHGFLTMPHPSSHYTSGLRSTNHQSDQ